MNVSSRPAIVLCLSLTAWGCAGASAAPAVAPEEASPAVFVPDDEQVEAAIARVLSGMVAHWFTDGLFYRVEGPNADLCLIEERDEIGRASRSKWVRFSGRRWEMATVRVGSIGERTWTMHTATFDEQGRLALVRVTEFAPGGPKARDVWRMDWSLKGSVARMHVDEMRALEEYRRDPEAPGVVNLRRLERSPVGTRLAQTLTVGPSWLDIRHVGEGDIWFRHAWASDGSVEVTGFDGSSDVTQSHDVHGALQRSSRRPMLIPSYEWSVRFDDLGRPSSVDQGIEKRITHYVYGCDWPYDSPRAQEESP